MKETTGYLLAEQISCYFANENWSMSDPDPKLIIPDPDPDNNFGSNRRIRVRIHNTAFVGLINQKKTESLNRYRTSLFADSIGFAEELKKTFPSLTNTMSFRF